MRAMQVTSRAALAALALLAIHPAWAQQPSPVIVRGLSPATPRPMEPVNLRLTINNCETSTEGITLNQDSLGFRVIVTSVPIICPATRPPDSYNDIEVMIGAFPAGTYSVRVSALSMGSPPIPLMPEQTLTFHVAAPVEAALVPPPSRPLTDYSGAWWNPEESGWGVSLHQSASRQMFVAFYIYDSAGLPVWYVAPSGTWSKGTRWTGTLYRTSGPRFIGFTFDPLAVTRIPVGTLSFDFAPNTFLAVRTFGNATMFYTIDGVTASKTIQKFVF